MNKQSLTALAGAVMFVAIVALWVRVHSLEQAIQTLNKRPQAAIVPIAQPQPGNHADKEPVFKLIEGAKHNERTSNVGVPWEVERARIPVPNDGPKR